MRHPKAVYRWVLCALLLVSTSVNAACGTQGIYLQVLGSGGPAPDVGRASSSYLVWVDGKARLMIDAGGGAFARFAESQARLDDLDAILLTHLHADHAAELPALLKGAYFTDRTRALVITGPSGGGNFPGVDEFVDDLFGARHGAFRYLSGFLDGSDGMFKLDVRQLSARKARISRISLGDIQISSIGVEHGSVPALGYLIDIHGTKLAFSGDQNGNNPAFAELIRDANWLVMTHAIPEAADPVAAGLHARPSEIAALAKRANVKHLLLSHLMRRSLDSLDASLAIMRAHYSGEVRVASDLLCVRLR
jgi:ribonuclease BN (tRNA processing enzyme)